MRVRVWALLGYRRRSRIDRTFCQNLPKYGKKAQKSIPNRIKILPKSFKIEVWRSSGQLLAGCGRQKASQTLPRRLQDASGEALGLILVDFGVSWGRLGEILGGNPGASWDVLRPLGASWGSLGPNFCSKREVDRVILSWMAFSNRFFQIGRAHV